MANSTPTKTCPSCGQRVPGRRNGRTTTWDCGKENYTDPAQACTWKVVRRERRGGAKHYVEAGPQKGGIQPPRLVAHITPALPLNVPASAAPRGIASYVRDCSPAQLVKQFVRRQLFRPKRGKKDYGAAIRERARKAVAEGKIGRSAGNWNFEK